MYNQGPKHSLVYFTSSSLCKGNLSLVACVYELFVYLSSNKEQIDQMSDCAITDYHPDMGIPILTMPNLEFIRQHIVCPNLI